MAATLAERLRGSVAGNPSTPSAPPPTRRTTSGALPPPNIFGRDYGTPMANWEPPNTLPPALSAVVSGIRQGPTMDTFQMLKAGQNYEAKRKESGAEGDFDFMAGAAGKFGGFLNKITGGGAGQVWDAVDEPLLAAMTVIDKPRSVVVSTIQESVDFFQGEGFSGSDWAEQIGNNIGFNEVLDDMGVENIWVRRIAGLTGDVLLDPLTYIPLVGQAYKAGAITGKGFALAGAKSIDDDVLRGFAKETAAKASRLGPQALNADELARLATLDAVEQVATRRGIPVSQIMDSSFNIIDHADEVAAIPIHPGLEAGVRLTVPGTGRLAQRVRNSKFTPGSGISRPKTIQIAPQAANRFTPGGAFQAVKSKIGRSDSIGLGTLRQYVNGDHHQFKKMLRSADPDEVQMGYVGLAAAARKGGTSKRFVVDQMRELVELEKKIGGKQNLRHIIPALQSGVSAVADLPDNVQGAVREALTALGDDGLTAARSWRDGIRVQANMLSGATDPLDPFVKYLETWAPNKYSEEFHAAMLDTAEATTPEGASLRQAISGEQKVAKIRPGGTYYGEEIMAVTDPRNKHGLTPREQADQILTQKMSDMGMEFHGAIFSDDFHESAVASILALGDEVGLNAQQKVLNDFGITVDLSERLAADTNRAAAKENAAAVALEALKREQSVFRRSSNFISDKINSRVAAKRAEAANVDVKRKAVNKEVEAAERWERSVNKVVDSAEKSRNAAVKARDDLLLEIQQGATGKVERLNQLRKKIQETDGKTVKRIGRLEKRRAKALAEIHDLRRRGVKALGRDTGTIKSLPEVGKRTRALRRELAVVNEELDVLRHWMDIDPGDIDLKKATIGAVDEDLAKVSEQIDTLGTARTPEANRQRKELKARRDELEAIKGDAEDFIRTYEGVLADLPGAEGHTRYVEALARQDEAIERLETIFQMQDITPQQADQLLRRLRNDPGAIEHARLRQAEAALGDQADQLKEDLARLESYANTPEGLRHPVHGTVIANRRNAENLWGVTDQGPYGPVLTTRTTDIPRGEMDARDLRDPRTGHKIKEKNLRYHVEGENPKVYYGGIDDVNFDALEVALTDGLRPSPSWGAGWDEVATMVRSKAKGGQGLTLNHAIREVFPYTGSDPKKLIRGLLDDPTTLSGYSRQRMAKLFRDHNTNLGHDSIAYADLATSNWNLIPNDRRAIVGFSSELPDDLGQSLARYSEWQQATVHDNIAARQKLADELGGDIEELSGRRELVGPRAEAEIDQMIGDVEVELERALAAADEETVQLVTDRQRGLERARELQAKATQHLDNVKKMADEGMEPLDAQYEALMADVAQLEAAAAKVKANKKFQESRRRADAKANGEKRPKTREQQLAASIKTAEKDLEKLRNMPDAVFNDVLQRGEKQVGWNSDRAIPEKLATILSERSELTKGKLVKHYDTFLKAWRAGATSSPGFHMRNYMGGVINNIHAGMDPAMYGHWGSMQREFNLQMQGGRTRNLRRGNLSLNETLDPEAALEAAGEALKERGFDARMVENFKAVTRSGVAEGGQFDELGLANALEGAVTKRDKFNTAANPFSSKFAVYRKSRNVGGHVENRLRGSLALDAMMNGDDITAAVNRVHKFHFDYDDLSSFERNKLHRTMAFYTWTRKNLPLQLEMLFDNPRAFQRYLAVQRNIEVGTEEQNNLPDWQSRLGRIKLPWGDGIYLNPDMPFSDLTQMVDLKAIAEGDPLTAIKTTGSWAINSSSPLVKLPVQGLAGKDLFTNAPFEGEVTAVSPTWSAFPGIMSALSSRGLAYKDSEDEWVMPKSAHAVVTGLFPALATAHRLVPQIGTGNGRRESEQVASSLISWAFGAGNYVHTETKERNVHLGRAFDIRDEAEFQKTLGNQDKADELYEQFYDRLDEIEDLWPREEGS